VADEVDQLTQAAVARFKLDLEQVVSRLRTYLAERLKRTAHLDDEGRLVSDDWNAELAAKLEAEWSGILRDLGYDGALHTLLDSFEAVAAQTGVQLQDRLGTSLSGAAQRSMAAFVDGTVDRLLIRRGDAGARLREVLVLGAQTNVPLDREIEDLADAAGVTLRQGVVEAETQLMGFHRDALATDAESGIDLYVYDGPDDGITRPFCAPLVGKIVTVPDLDAMENGDSQPKPVSRYLGGYRCRHSLSPISLEEGLGMVRTGGANAIAPECPLARRILLQGEAGPAQSAFTSGLGELYRAAVG
jgi:hypothetical protein